MLYKDAFFDPDKQELYLVMEHMNCDTLETMIKHKARQNKANGQSCYFEEKHIWKFLIDCLLGLDYIHCHQIIHRDIKSSNIFINIPTVTKINTSEIEAKLDEAQFKIGDFNISTFSLTGFETTMAGTPFFASPEMLAAKEYTYNNDVW